MQLNVGLMILGNKTEINDFLNSNSIKKNRSMTEVLLYDCITCMEMTSW